MTTMNNTREQQLMEDFEWKLREMEKDHKKKLEEKDRKAEVRCQGQYILHVGILEGGGGGGAGVGGGGIGGE